MPLELSKYTPAPSISNGTTRLEEQSLLGPLQIPLWCHQWARNEQRGYLAETTVGEGPALVHCIWALFIPKALSHTPSPPSPLAHSKGSWCLCWRACLLSLLDMLPYCLTSVAIFRRLIVKPASVCNLARTVWMTGLGRFSKCVVSFLTDQFLGGFLPIPLADNNITEKNIFT